MESKFPEWLIVFSEVATILTATWLVVEAGKLAFFFITGRDRITSLLKNEFLSDMLQAGVTLSMGVALLLNDKFFIQTLIVIRPWVLLLNVYG